MFWIVRYKMYDNYVHLDNRVIYTEENIPGPAENSKEYEELIETYNSQLSGHCLCIDKCLYPTCNCLLKKRNNNYIQNSRYEYKINMSGESPIVECNSQCSCCEQCGNRVVQKGPMEGLIVKICPENKKGLGLFCSKFIPSGTFICEYAGELLTKSQAIVRNKYIHSNNEMNYIFCLNEICNGVIQQTFVDPKSFGNVGRYINHSCEPNCHIIPVRCDMPIPKLAIFSLRDISSDMELTFDYGSNIAKSSCLDNSHVKKKQCLCNSSTCKKFLPNHEY